MKGDRRDPREAARASEARLAAVRATGLLGAEATEALDRYSRLAAQLLNVPVAFLSLVDAERDFYVAQSGFSGALAEKREIRGTTFCHFGLVSGGPVVIDDTRVDPAHRAVPTVQSLGVAAYLGIPIKAADGEVIGSLCAIDYEPHRWSAHDQEILSALADGAQREISLLVQVGATVREADEAHAARRAFESISKARQVILALVAHDLRTPLNVLALAQESLAASATDARSTRSLAIARRQTATMKRMIEDLLDDARFREGEARITVERVDVGEFLGDLAADFDAIVTEARLTFETSVAPERLVAPFDRRRLSQALSNLISNAIRFTAAGGTIRVDARRMDDALELEVRDTGKGISPAVMATIFDPYSRGESSGSGLGLGLSIARSIATLHGGDIAVRSAPGDGASFTIRIPLDGA